MKHKTRTFIVLLTIFLVSTIFVLPDTTIYGENNQIEIVKATGRSTSGKEAELAIDGDKSTYYLTPPARSMKDHYRYIDLELDGIYDLSKIKIFNMEGSYNNYQIYASETGKDFVKVAYKNDTKLATNDGDTYTLEDVKASIVRINLSYNSKQLEGNLAEVELYGTRISDVKKEKTEIKVEDFKDSSWATEFDKFENDTPYAKDKTINEVYALVGRVIGEKWKDSFIFEVRDNNNNGKDIFEIENHTSGKIIIRGNNGIALASGFNHYLRYYCKVDYNPMFASNLVMPDALPLIESKIVKETEYDYRYALNFCTYSYTMAFWGWNEFEAFLDWAAMSGINTMLDIVGQEEVIRRTLSKFGYTDEEIKEYIVGPGYFAWFYMQNMTSFGGELPDNWFSNRVELGRKMHDRMQTYGITPVLSGFSGMIPRNFKEKYPDVEYVAQGSWAGSGYERPDMLRTYLKGNGRDYFADMADEFYKAQRDIFGDVTNIYAVDPFHEGGNIGDMNASIVYETIQKKMIEHDSDAIWLIQQWSGSMTDAKLSGLKVKNQALVLDLFTEVNPSYAVMERNGIPWVWNMLHNFGGRMGLDGNPEKISQNIPKNFAETNQMKGIGITPEAIENSPMVYELLFDMTWTKDPIDYRAWVQDYAERNYGGTNDDIQEAWDILLETGYNTKEGYYQGAPESVFNTRPRTDFTSASSWGHSTINYDKKELERAVGLLAKHYDTFKDSPSYIYDLSDVTRQVISNSALDYYTAMMRAYNSKNVVEFKLLSSKFLEMMQLQDRVLATNPNFLVGTWIQKSRDLLIDADDWTKDLFEYNARTLITTWGSKGESDGGLRDYSNRQWAGLTKDYYYPRWELFINDTIAAMENGSSLPTLNSYNWFLQESKWSTKKTDEGSAYATTASGENLQELTEEVLQNYTVDSLKKLTGSVKEKQNIALGKTVTCSVETDPDTSTENLTDGNRGTPWRATRNVDEFTLIVDLEQLSSIDGIEISMEQIPKQFPYNYQVDVYQNGNWENVSEGTSGNMASNEVIDYKGIASKVRFTFTTTDSSIIPEIYELQIYGDIGLQEEYKNVALGKSATANGIKTDKITDGNPSTLWVSSNGSYPVEIIVDLGNEEYVDYMELYFEKVGLRFQYDVIIEDANGNRSTFQDKTDNTDDLDVMYKIDINAKVKKVYVNLKGKADGGSYPLAWPALAEIKLMQSTDATFSSQNIAFGKPGKVINTNPYDTTKLTDGNLNGLENVGTDIFPTTFQVDLGRDEFLDEIHIYFEKAGLRFQFKVEVEAADGSTTTILDKIDNTDDLDASYVISANVTGQKINVIITGRAPGGSFYLASPAMTQIEAYAKPKNIISDVELISNVTLSDDEKKALVDGNESTVVDLNGKKDGEAKEFTFIFDKPKDIYAYELFKTNMGPIQYRVEALPDETIGTDWIILEDKMTNVVDAKKYVKEFEPLLVKKIRLTIMNDDAIISNFNVYEYDATIDLVSYVSTLKTKIGKLSIGEYAGNYGKEAKEALDIVIADVEVRMRTSLNSLEVAKEIQLLKKAYQQFLTSYITIDRTPLLIELTEVDALLKMDAFHNNQELKTAYTDAKTVYNTTKITQKEINDRKDLLAQVKENALATLISSKERYVAQLSIAKALVDSATVGDRPGNIYQETLDMLQATITKAEFDYKEDMALDAMDTITEELKEAIKVFKESYVVVDKTQLQATIVEAETLQEKDYTKDSWKKIQDAKASAITIVNHADSSVSEVENARVVLQQAIDDKVMLDRSKLANLIFDAQQLKEADYSKSSWEALTLQLEEAITLNKNISLNQNEVNEMVEKLRTKISQLIPLDSTVLQDLISKVQQLEGSDYTDKTWNALLTVLKQANQLISHPSKEQEEIDKMVDKLKLALNKLEVDSNTETARKELEEKIKEAEKYLTPEKYTFETYTKFKDAYNKAIALLKQTDSVTNSMLKKATEELDSGIKGLEKFSANPKNPDSNGTNESVTGDTTDSSLLLLLILMSGGILLVTNKKLIKKCRH